MWIGDYERGRELRTNDENFDALLTALVMKADTHNAALLREVFPRQVAEIQRRYDSPGGALTLDEWVHRYCDEENPEPPSHIVERLRAVASVAAMTKAEGGEAA